MRPIILVPLLLLAACGGNDGKTITVKDGDKDVTINAKDNGGVTTIQTTGDKGEKVTASIGGEGTAWPADAPPYAIAYPGAKVTAVISSNGGTGSTGSVVTFESSDAPERIIGFYKGLSAKAGLKEGMTMNSGGTSMFASGKEGGGGNGFVVQASAEGGKTTASVTVGKDG